MLLSLPVGASSCCVRLHYLSTFIIAIIACLFSTTSFAPITCGFQATRLVYLGTRSRSIYLHNHMMNKGSLTVSEDTQQPSSKKMRTSPALEATTMGSTSTAMNKGTLYITVGPQCAGKTTILKDIFGKSFHKNEEHISESLTKEEATAAGVDITIDDQELVYIPVPTSHFRSTAASSAAPHASPPYPPLNQTVFGKSIRERIVDPSNAELVLVLERLGGALSKEEFASRLLEGKDNGKMESRTAQEDLVDAVENVMQLQTTSCDASDKTAPPSLPVLPETIDLFVVESIFRPRPLDLLKASGHNGSASETLSAVDQALHLLKTHATNPQIHSSRAPLSWGNTNTRPREFQSALEAAASSGRPVEFIVYGGAEACDMIREHVSRREYRKMSHDKEEDSASDKKEDSSSKDEHSSERLGLLCLPKVDRKTLLVRNVQRFLQTGRYIPSNAIADAVVRVESLLANAAAEANKEYPNQEKGESKGSMGNAKFKLDYELTKLAGYRMDADRTVSPANVRHDNNRGNGNNLSARNNYQTGRGAARYHSGRGRSYGGRGGRSNYGRGNNWERNRQDQSNRPSYNSGRGGYDQNRWRESDRYHERREYEDRGNRYHDRDHGGHGREGGRHGWSSSNYRSSGGRGGGQYRGRGLGRGDGSWRGEE